MSNKSSFCVSLHLLGVIWVGSILPYANVSAQGGIATDGSMGLAQTLTGHQITIPQDLGKIEGHNLFHSFSEFNINSGQLVEFSGGNTLQNVISRVTGGDLSQINGELKSSIANANFYLINPNGVIFGAGAVVNVPADFHVSTANQIGFADGNVFYADQNSNTISSALPSAFGFLDTSVTNNGLLAIDNGAQIQVADGQSIDISARNIEINRPLDSATQLKANGGEIRLIALQGNGEISLLKDINGDLPLPIAIPAISNAGQITISADNLDLTNASLETSGNGGGRIALWGGETKLINSAAFADNSGVSDANSGKGVEIQSYSLNQNNSWISADSYNANDPSLAAGNPGNVLVKTTDAIVLSNNAYIKSNTFSQSNGGNLIVQAKTITLENGSNFSTSTHNKGDAGNIMVTTDRLSIDNQNNSRLTGIRSSALRDSHNANAGTITVKAIDLAIINGGQITTSTLAKGNAGNVDITAQHLSIDNQSNETPNVTGIFSESKSNDREPSNSGGQAGGVTIKADNLAILNGGIVSTSTDTAGDAGNIAINTKSLTISGQSPFDTGIFSEAKAASGGQAGRLFITASQSIHLRGFGKISIENAAHATNLKSIKNSTININTPDLDLLNSTISTNASGNVAAGDINLALGHWLTLDSSSINTRALTGNGGNIKIGQDCDLIQMHHSTFETSVSEGNSKGGNIDAATQVLVMNAALIQANADGGFGGNITINAQALIPSSNSLLLGGARFDRVAFEPRFNLIQAASRARLDGQLSITSPQLNLSGLIANLGHPQFNTDMISPDYCGLGLGSSLTRQGAGGLHSKGGDTLFY
ncbi:MAG: filamentous hemagglutinin N-terminal domain-containing protein [Methylococcaceae bacterium]|jgi:filamentous hemagglutinin family protein